MPLNYGVFCLTLVPAALSKDSTKAEACTGWDPVSKPELLGERSTDSAL